MGGIKRVYLGKKISKNEKYSKVDKHMKLAVIERWTNIKGRREYKLA